MPPVIPTPQYPSAALCQTFLHLALRVWQDLADCKHHRLSRSEEAITSDILLELTRSHAHEVRIYQFDKPEEASSGADWDWWFTDGEEWYGIRVQAKKLDGRNCRYSSLGHRVGSNGRLQIEILLAEAHRLHLFPMYCFYNYWDTAQRITWNCRSYDESNVLFACAVADARAVKAVFDQGDIRLAKMSSISLPRNCLVCCPFAAHNGPSLPRTVQGIARRLTALPDGGDVEAMDGRRRRLPRMRRRAPEYIERLLDTSEDRVRSALDETKRIVGSINGIVVVKDRSSIRYRGQRY